MTTIISAIFVFLLVILLHEAGHLVAAKASGIKVNEFAVGMGPKIFGKQKGETLYSLRALPIGGYCACLLYTSPSPRDRTRSRMPSSA